MEVEKVTHKETSSTPKGLNLNYPLPTSKDTVGDKIKQKGREMVNVNHEKPFSMLVWRASITLSMALAEWSLNEKIQQHDLTWGQMFMLV